MKRLNIKLAVILLVSVLVLVVGVHVIHGLQVGGNAEKWLAHAREIHDGLKPQIKEGSADLAKLREAFNYLQRYLKQRPDDGSDSTEALDRLGDVVVAMMKSPEVDSLEEFKDLRYFYLFLEQSLRAQATPSIDARRHFITASRMLNQLSVVEEQVNAVLSRLPKGDPELEHLLAYCLFARQEPDKALEILHRLTGFDKKTEKFDPVAATGGQMLDAYTLMAGIYRQQENARLTQITYDRMIEDLAKTGKGPDAYLIRANYYLAQRDAEGAMDKAKADIEEALKLAPQNVRVALTASGVMMQTNDLPRAKSILETALKEHPENENLYLQLFQANRSDPLAAMKAVQRGLEKSPTSPWLLNAKAELQLNERNLDGARETHKTLLEMQKSRRNDPRESRMIDSLAARLLMLEDNYLEAARTFERLRETARFEDSQRGQQGDKRVTIEIDHYLALCYEALNMPDRQREAYLRILEANRGLLAAHAGVASALMGLGKYQEATEVYRMLVASDVKLAEKLDILQGWLNAAIAEQLQTARSRRRWDNVDVVIDRLEKAPNVDRAWVLAWKADIRFRQERFDEARRLADETRKLIAAEKDKTKVKAATLRLADVEGRLVERDKGPAEALKVIERAEAETGDSLMIRMMKSTLIARRGGPDVETDLAKLEQGVEKFKGEEKAQLWESLAGFYSANRDWNEARRLLKQVMDQRRHDPRIRVQLLELAWAEDNDKVIDEAMDDLLKLLGKDDALWSFVKAQHHLRLAERSEQPDRDLAEARALVKKAADARPLWHDPPRLSGEINLKQDDKEAAIQDLKKSLQLGPPLVRTVRALTDLLAGKGQLDEARKTLELLGSAQRAPDIRKAYVDLLFSTEQASEAIKEADSLMADLEKATPTAADYAWYSAVLIRVRKEAEAEKTLRKAVEKEPANARYWVALVQQLVKLRKPDEAEEALRQLQLALPEDQVDLVLAQCYQTVGRVRQAQEIYEAAVARDPDNLLLRRTLVTHYGLTNQDEKANRQLDLILRVGEDPDKKYDPTVVWARRQKAQILSMTGDYQEFGDALALIKENEQSDKPDQTDVLLRVQVLSERTERVHLNEAIDLLLEMKKQRALRPAELLALARLYEKTDRWPRGRELMQDLMNLEGRNANYLAMFCQMLIRHREMSDAEYRFKKLQEVQPDSLVTKKIQVEILASQGRRQQAYAVLQGMLPEELKGTEPLSPEQQQAARSIGQLMELVGALDLAEPLYRKLNELNADPSYKLKLAEVIARQGKIDEALDLLDGLPKKALDPITRIATLVIRQAGAKAKPEHHKRVEEWLDRFMRYAPDSPVPVMRMAEFRESQQKYDEVIRLYRIGLSFEIQGSQPRAVVINNLAYLLALTGQPDESLEQINEAMKVLGPQSDLLDTRGVAYLVQGKCRQAADDFEESVQSGPHMTKHFHLACARMCLGDESGAREALKAGEKLGLSREALPHIEHKLFDDLLKNLKIDKLGSEKK